MGEYRISGIWKNSDGVITHYAMHVKSSDGYTRASKTTKPEAIKIVENNNNNVSTWLWNYKLVSWQIGEKVIVSTRNDQKYLRTEPDDSVRDNLQHLIDFDWIKE